MFQHRTFLFLVLVSIVAIIGCGNNTPVIPSDNIFAPLTSPGKTVNQQSRWLGGLWQLGLDTENETVEAIPLRTADFHFNLIPVFFEGTPNTKLGFSNIQWDASNHQFQIDISMTHPFPAAVNVPGFDVRGIIFTRGGMYNIAAGNVIMSGPLEPRLANADGYTRWWNPVEFMNGPLLLSYVDGLYGTPAAIANYQSTIYGYKYYADSLGAVESIHNMNTADRGIFRPTSTNTRRFLIDFGDFPDNWMIVNYAFDVCWGPIPGWKPGDDPPVLPDDFPYTSNSPEPYRMRVTESMNSLTRIVSSGTSGTVNINIDIFDWQALDPLSTVPIEVSVVQVEIPVFGIPPVIATPVPGSGAGGHMSTYTASITGSTPDYLENIDLVITATSSEGDYQNGLTGFLAGDPLQAFFLHQAPTFDGTVYNGWTYKYTKLLYPEYPNQGQNPPDIAVYKKASIIRAAMVDQINPDINGTHDTNPDSINEWSSNYTKYSLPEHYHMPTGMLGMTGLWNDVGRICVSDSSTKFFFTSTSSSNEFADGESDPLYSYLTWLSHTYLGNMPAELYFTVSFSQGDYPRFWSTDPCNGVKVGTDFIYNIFIFDVTGMASGDPGVDPQRYIILRWGPPYDEFSATWQRPFNVPPNGYGEGYVDRDRPYDHRLAVDDSPGLDRFYILDSNQEIEVVDCNFSLGEFDGSWSISTIMPDIWPPEVTGIVDIEVVATKTIGEPRNYVAALCKTGLLEWRIWVFDLDTSPDPNVVNDIWLSEPYFGEAYSMDATDDPIELHVLSKLGTMTYVSVFRDYP